MTDWHIRPIGAHDNLAIAEIIRDVMPEYGAVGPGYSINDAEVDDMHGAYSRVGHRYFVLENSGVVYGGSGIGPLVAAEDNVCELRKMYVARAGRGSGNGRALLDACLAFAIQTGYTGVYLETLARMDEARRLYERAGFQFIDRPLGNTGHTTCDRYMMKALP